MQYVPSVGVEVVQVNRNSANVGRHKGEALGRQAVSRVQVALVPLDPLQSGPLIIRDRVQPAAEGHAAGCGGAVGVVVGLVDVGVIVEVLLQVDDIVSPAGQLLADEVRVDALIPGDAVVVEDGREAGDVVGEEGEAARLRGGGGRHQAGAEGRVEDRARHDNPFVSSIFFLRMDSDP